MTQILDRMRAQRRRSAMVLLFVWLWCLAAGVFAQGMGPMSEGHASVIPDAAQPSSVSAPECCPEANDLLPGKLTQFSLLMAAVLSWFVLAVSGLRPGTGFSFGTRRLIPSPPRRLYVLHCTYLN
ncbi:hypothetical protein [Marinobacter sp.]|uniref:hypothetical protein n=1 Tax=Marinobacter sp. TaxID=50741 RepID=UPI00384E2E28